MSDNIRDIVELMAQIESDFSVPRNIRVKMKDAMNILEDDEGRMFAVRADKALEELEALSDDSNIPTYTRTQVWHIISLLEGCK